ncbi:NAD(P)/FAD-dependent oxidoreductase [Chloroflexota bacterium]
MKVVIIGAGPAGVTVAETLRYYDTQIEIVMVSAEPYAPYSPPAMLASFTGGQELHFWKGEDFADRLGIDYRSGTEVQAVIPKDNNVRLSDNQALTYDILVLTTGARLYSPIEGQDKPGIYNLKSLSSVSEIFDKVHKKKAKNAIIVGAGFIGVETGVVLADMGFNVTQLVRSRVLRLNVDTEISGIIQGVMQARGVNVINGAEADAEAFVGNGRAEGVRTKSGIVHGADIIIAASGIKPNTEFLLDSPLKVESMGIPVDAYLRTNIPNIYAAGDVAVTPNRVTMEQMVHGNFPNAVAQGKTVAQNILGWDTFYDGSDAMNSLKHLGTGVMVVGQCQGEEELVVRGDNTIRKIYLKDNRIIGFCLVGDVRSAGIYRILMNRGDQISAFKDRLLLPGFGMGYISSSVQ